DIGGLSDRGRSTACTPCTRRRRRELSESSLKLSLRINQEVGGGNNALAGPKALQHDKVVAHTQSGLYLPGLQAAIAMIDKGNLACAGLKHTRCWNHKLWPKRDPQSHIDVHAWFEQQTGILKNQPYAHSARCGINLRQDLVHAPVKC